MREIKFKVWDKARKVMLDDVRLSGMLNKKLKCKSVEFLQYTGLKDKNGVELYCADVCQVDGLGVCEVGICEFYGAVFKRDGWNHAVVESVVEQDGFEIIGNIYENPELLEQSK